VQKFIFIPVVNNLNLLEKAVKSVKPNLYNDYIIFNNTGQKIPTSIYQDTQFRVWDPIEPQSFMETQNMMRQYAISNNFDYYCFMHNDGEIQDNSDINIINYVENLKEPWGVVFTLYDVFCAYNTKAVEIVGKWGDPLWPKQKTGYFLDCDYYRRLKMHGFPEFNLPHSNILHAVSNTIKDSKELEIWLSQKELVVAHYEKKWGGLNGNETYKVPFNKEEWISENK